MARKRKDLTGQVFDRLTVKEYSHTAQNGVAYWVCECECGNVKVISGNNLQNRTTKSCGCLRNYKNRHSRKVKTYKLSSDELQEYLKELETKEVQYRRKEEE